MKLRQHKYLRIIAILFTFLFLFQSALPAIQPELASNRQPFTDSQSTVYNDTKSVYFFDLAGKYFLSDRRNPAEFKDFVDKHYSQLEPQGPAFDVDFESIIVTEESVSFSIQIEGARFDVIIGEADSTAHPQRLLYSSVIEGFPINIFRAEPSKDLAGSHAGEADSIIKQLIKEDKLVEIYLYSDDRGERLRANRVDFIEDYRTGITEPESYRGQKIGINQLLSFEAQKNLIEWIKNNRVRDIYQVKFRIALGDHAIGWDKAGIEHSNIAHAGQRDKVIYTGGILLNYLFADGNEGLRKKIIDEDEYQHLLGNSHGTDGEYNGRLSEIAKTIDSHEFERLKNSLLRKDVYYLFDRLRESLDDPERLFNLLLILNQAALSQPLFPVEITYPIKHAVALLEKYEEEKLKTIFLDKKYEKYRTMKVVDELLLMFGEIDRLDGWLENLKGRTIWEVSAEIWHEAGGLARVMQYHGVGMKLLLEKAGVRFHHIEPHYQNRIGTETEPGYTIDYTKRDDDRSDPKVRGISHPVKGLKVVSKFKIELKKFRDGIPIKNIVDVEVSRGINDLGIEVYLVKDKGGTLEDGKTTFTREGFYTHSLYNYAQDPFEDNLEIPSWEDFSIFYSKAVLKFIRMTENDRREKHGASWKAPVIHLNDSQTALVSVYRIIELDEEEEKQRNNPTHSVDPVLRNAYMAFTTHTYRNRNPRPYPGKKMGVDSGERILELMEIPSRYKQFFERKFHELYDMASSGLRPADWRGAVARAHRNDIDDLDYDKWWPGLKLIGIANGDNRRETARVYRKIMTPLFGKEVDLEHPTPDQVYMTKKEAKKRLRLPKGQEVHSTDELSIDKNGIILLDPDMPVISYSGRLVDEKAGAKRAFTYNNIDTLLRAGVQVVIYGNKQAGGDYLYGHFKWLVESFKGKNYKGKLIFVPRFSLNDQRALLAATDIQVQDSDPGTEAAGFTEADISATGGIELATYRVNPDRSTFEEINIGEGLFLAQGVPLDFDIPGKGNVVMPEGRDSSDYVTLMLRLVNLYSKNKEDDKLKYYQATSIRLSRAIEAINTARAYLIEFNNGVAEKERNDRDKKIIMLEKLVSKYLSPLETRERKSIRQIFRLVLSGYMDKALTQVYLNNSFHDENASLDTMVHLLNALLEAYTRTYRNDLPLAANIEKFIRALKDSITVFLDGKDLSKAVQIMAGEAMTIIEWLESNEVHGAANLRLSANPERQIKNPDRGKSFIDLKSMPAYISEAKKEETIGFFWRGAEGIGKLGNNVKPDLVYDHENFEKRKENVIMYIMHHGFVKTPDGIITQTNKKRVSTLHDTFFINDTIPGSIQSTSTGAGHYQNKKLDIKYVTEGIGVQLNIRYNLNGEIEEIIAHEVQSGDWTFALPGYVDYMINLGGLRFNDISISLTNSEAKRFNKDYSEANNDKLRNIFEKNGGNVPYTGAIIGKESYILVAATNGDTIENIRSKTIWLSGLNLYTGDQHGLARLYRENLSSPEDINRLVDTAQSGINRLLGKARGILSASPELFKYEVTSEVNSIDDIKERIKIHDGQKISLNNSAGLTIFIDGNKEFLSKRLYDHENGIKLIRIPIEWLQSANDSRIINFLQALQQSNNINVQLFSLEEGIDVTDGSYAALGLSKKEIPAGFKMTRENTLTIYPVFNGKELYESPAHRSWDETLGGIKVSDSIISPIGWDYDQAGLLRSTILGLRLNEIARNSYDENDPFVVYTFLQYMDMAVSQGITNFELEKSDLVKIARGENMTEMIKAINRLIKYLPIMPMNLDEQREVYEHASAVLSQA